MASLEPFSLASKNVRAFTAINNIPRIRTSCVPLSHFPLQLSRSGLTTIFSYFQNSRKFGEKLKAKSLIAVLCAGSISRVSATNNEEANARTAAATANTGAPTMVLAFRDINLQAPVHVILIPPEGLTELGKAEAQQRDILGKLLYAAKIVAEKEGILDGFPVVINSGPTACQSVYHLHLHVLGGRQMKWPPG